MKSLILVVEDQPINQEFFNLVLNKLGFSAVFAGNGAEGLEMAAAHPADLVFMDLWMPQMDGFEAARALRRKGFTKPIIAATAGIAASAGEPSIARVSPEEEESCAAAGFDDILIKPFKIDDIRNLLRKWLPPEMAPEKSAEEKPFRASENNIFDMRDLKHTFLDNIGLINCLLKEFYERTAKQLAGIPALIQAGNWEESQRIAHMIKGSSLTLSGRELGKRAAVLESASKNRNPGEAKTALCRLKAAFEEFKETAEARAPADNS